MVNIQFSIDRINHLAPYRVWLSESDGSFRFVSDFNIEFVIDFMEDDLLKSALSYQLLIGNIGNKKSPRDLKVRDTILIIIEDFFMNNQSALLYICETGDGKQMARGRLFAYWFESSAMRRLFTTISSTLLDEDGIENTATLIIRNDNPNLHLLVAEFSQTIRFLSEKPL